MSKQIYGFTPAKYEGQYPPFLAVFENNDGTFTFKIREGGDATYTVDIDIPAAEAHRLGNDLIGATLGNAPSCD